MSKANPTGRVRVEFRLSMPRVSSWNGQWSGAGRNYAIVRSIRASRAAELLRSSPFTHSFGDGWVAAVDARLLPEGERAKKSDGFCGYDWMVDRIIAFGSTSLDGGGK